MRFAIDLAVRIALVFSATLYAGASSHEKEAQDAPEVSAPPQPAEGDQAPTEAEEAPAEDEKKAEEAEPDPN